MTQKNKASDRATTLSAYIKAKRLTIEAARHEAEKVSDQLNEQITAVYKTEALAEARRLKLPGAKVVSKSEIDFMYRHYYRRDDEELSKPELKPTMPVKIEFKGGRATLYVRIDSKLRRKFNAAIKKHRFHCRDLQETPSPNAPFPKWREAAIRDALTANPALCDKIVKMVEKHLPKGAK